MEEGVWFRVHYLGCDGILVCIRCIMHRILEECLLCDRSCLLLVDDLILLTQLHDRVRLALGGRMS